MKMKIQTTAKRRLIKKVVRPPARTRESGRRLLPPKLKIKKILVPTDFSSAAKNALAYASDIAKQFGAKITVLHVVEPMPTSDFSAYPLALPLDEMLKENKRSLDRFARHELDEKLLQGTRLSVGRPFREITAAARSLNADLIIIATHGHTGLAHAILGSTAERVVRYSPCPVLTVREKENKSTKG